VKPAQILFWLAAAFALTMASLPHPPELPGEPSDKIQHILAFAVLAGLAAVSFQNRSGLWLFVALAGFGALIEIFQLVPQLHRSSDVRDWLADAAASAVVLTLFRMPGWWRRANANR
jgi:VanZ family protein